MAESPYDLLDRFLRPAFTSFLPFHVLPHLSLFSAYLIISALLSGSSFQMSLADHRTVP
jgi:hypothetical protein